MPDFSSPTAFLLQLEQADFDELASQELADFTFALRHAQSLCEDALKKNPGA
jgi:hypothetical protein